jgi:hypothetical protein
LRRKREDREVMASPSENTVLLGKPQGLRVFWDWNVYVAAAEMASLRVLKANCRWNVWVSSHLGLPTLDLDGL